MVSSKSENSMKSILDDDFVSLFFYYICMTHEYLSKPFTEFFRTEYHLNGKQMAAVGYLKQSKSMTMGELSEKADISKQQTTQLVNSLVEKGFVSRESNPKNRREVIIKPTKLAIESLIEGENIFLTNAMVKIREFLGNDTEEFEKSLRCVSEIIPKMNFSMENRLPIKRTDNLNHE